MEKMNDHKVLYGIRSFSVICCDFCGYVWEYDLYDEYDDYCPRCGARV